MAKFKVVIDAQDNNPVFINPDQVKMVFQYNDSKQTCIVLEQMSPLSQGLRVPVNAAVIDVVEYLENITDTIQLNYFSDTEKHETEEVQKEKLYKVLINCKNVHAVGCAVDIMVRHGIVENNSSAKAEAARDIVGPLIEDVYAWFPVKEGMEKAEAKALCNDFTNHTCINAKMEEM